MKKAKSASGILYYLSMIGQLGLSLALPPVICVLCAVYLQKKCGIPEWSTVAAIIIGIICSACTFYKVYKSVTAANNKDVGKNEKN